MYIVVGCQLTKVHPRQLLRKMSAVTNAERAGEKENKVECNAAQAVEPPRKDEIQALSRQLGSEDDCTNTSKPDSRHALKEQRRTVCNLPTFVRNVDTCLLEVSIAASEDGENVIHRRSKGVNTALKSLKQRLSTKICNNLERDVLLTPLSEGRLSSHVRPQPAATDVLSRQGCTGSLVAIGLTPAGTEISEPRASVLSHVSKVGERLNDSVEMDVIESIAPESAELHRTCTLIPLQVLSQNNAFVDDDTEVDVFVRSFWDEGSDPESPHFNKVVDLRDSNDRGIGSRLKNVGENVVHGRSKGVTTVLKSLKQQLSTKTGNNFECDVLLTPLDAAGKQKKKTTATTVNKKSKRRRSKTSCYCCTSSGRNQNGAEADGSIARYGGMTLRPRKKANVNDAERRASFPCRKRLSCQRTKTRKEKCQSSKTQREMSKKSRKPSPKQHTVAANSKAAGRKRIHSYSKSTSPLLSSKASDRPCCRTRKSKASQSPRKHVVSDVPMKQPSKRQKLSKETNVAESGKPQATDSAIAVRCSSRLRAARLGSDQQAAAQRETGKQSKTGGSTRAKTSHSAKQLVKQCVTSQQDTRVRKAQSKAAPAQQTHDQENINTAATSALQSDRVKDTGDAGSLPAKAKKSRCVVIFCYAFYVNK